MTSIVGRAIEEDIIRLNAVNIRDYTNSKHGKTDDYPYGGGAGMVMQAQPVYDAYKAVEEQLDYKPRVVYLTPQGRIFDQPMARELALEKGIVFLCGHYEGIDERVLDEIVTDHVSIGDYILTGGELPAMCMIDAISRMIPGVLHNDESAEDDSLSDGLLEFPQYSRPEVWNGRAVPKILLSGDHAKVDAWRREQSLIRTAERRPDLLEKAAISPKEREFIRKYLANREQV
jgi:tRNA (guanine37-N1)-methyltransferase